MILDDKTLAGSAGSIEGAVPRTESVAFFSSSRDRFFAHTFAFALLKRVCLSKCSFFVSQHGYESCEGEGESEEAVVGA